MRLNRLSLAALTSALLVAAGCATYRFSSNVPQELRTISVPLFENTTSYPELDAIVTQYVLRELQREGTFKIKRVDDASLKLLGTLTKPEFKTIAYDRNYSSRGSEYRYTLTAEITLVERGTGKVLMNTVPIRANTTFLAHGDMYTGMQDAYPRLAKELAREIVDALLAHW